MIGREGGGSGGRGAGGVERGRGGGAIAERTALAVLVAVSSLILIQLICWPLFLRSCTGQFFLFPCFF